MPATAKQADKPRNDNANEISPLRPAAQDFGRNDG
jgi:hypothetical protein